MPTLTINHLDAHSPAWWAVKPDGGSWTPIYVPSTPCKVEHSNVVGADSGRDETGIMHIDWVRRDVRKVYIHYNAITETELAYIMNLMQGKEFQFRFRDQGATQTIDAYASESNYQFYSYSSLYAEGVYTDFEIHVIEL